MHYLPNGFRQSRLSLILCGRPPSVFCKESPPQLIWSTPGRRLLYLARIFYQFFCSSRPPPDWRTELLNGDGFSWENSHAPQLIELWIIVDPFHLFILSYGRSRFPWRSGFFFGWCWITRFLLRRSCFTGVVSSPRVVTSVGIFQWNLRTDHVRMYLCVAILDQLEGSVQHHNKWGGWHPLCMDSDQHG